MLAVAWDTAAGGPFGRPRRSETASRLAPRCKGINALGPASNDKAAGSDMLVMPGRQAPARRTRLPRHGLDRRIRGLEAVFSAEAAP